MERRAGRVGRPARVSRRLIAEAALEVGLSTLTLTSLAHRLGVDHSTLYRHVASRDDIVLLACDTAIARMDWPEVPDSPAAVLESPDDTSWRTYLEQAVERVWDMYDRHPGLASAIHHLDTAPDQVVLRFTGAIRDLTRMGFAEAEAVLVLDTVLDIGVESYVGWERVLAAGGGAAERPASSSPIVDATLPAAMGRGLLALAADGIAVDHAAVADAAAPHASRRGGPAHSSGAPDALHAREEEAQRDALGTMDRVTARFSGEVATGSAATPRDWWRRKLGVILVGVGALRSAGPAATDR
ncbi:TetR/AcrR family transcriptional regulator [Clavibacter michiganensis]|uniref:TetR/AcrR family transcriptional regulator n=1 Tax=Clavibacter michiganensis TaxID=28447 RepID=UPI0009A6A316|nr:TetR family transcriptional regulator [Clavibacter michiganensis]MBF4638793.1 TetR family transcriptional regulator [Clavibacter michiganensis subsp. michiganensis]MDO4124958.1 TetR family transcriptional regulator [Clavibacter michiganensis]MDO4140280.1 TetR family transcriptional regulator [Clavibacter michiganensis]MWJ07907.1 TetR family transcriptional regulator [Clavibacter michiganensis subsp. michiganensis]MWJ89768.1 TetR family transcriptional regulator [Clavibacter michiganensis su